VAEGKIDEHRSHHQVLHDLGAVVQAVDILVHVAQFHPDQGAETPAGAEEGAILAKAAAAAIERAVTPRQ